MTEQNLEMIEIGCLFFMAAYNLILFFQIKRNYYLYLSLLCFLVFTRAWLVDDGSMLFYQVFPDVSRSVGRKIEFGITYSSLFLMPMFLNALYTFGFLSKYIKYFQIVGLMLILFVLVTPYQLFRYTLNIYHVIMVVGFIYSFIILFRAIKEKRTGSKWVLYGFIICFVFVFVEMFKNSGLVNFDTGGPNLVNTGVIGYLFFQSIALSAIFAKSFNENKALSKELDERVSARTEQLSKSNLVKQRFIRIVSHDLRGPLGNLKTTMTLLNDDVIGKEQSQELFRKIDKDLQGSLEMLDALLKWTKATTGPKLEVFTERVDVGKIVKTTISMFKEDAKKKKIKLIYVNRKMPVFIEADHNAVEVILRNLVSNGIKFTRTGGRVEVSCLKKQDSVEIRVLDSGIGIPDEMKETIFDMESKNNRPGTNDEKSSGVGLALCKDLVDQIGGKIGLEDSSTGEGTLFIVELKAS